MLGLPSRESFQHLQPSLPKDAWRCFAISGLRKEYYNKDGIRKTLVQRCFPIVKS
jgi:hypothetical protein